MTNDELEKEWARSVEWMTISKPEDVMVFISGLTGATTNKRFQDFLDVSPEQAKQVRLLACLALAEIYKRYTEGD